MRARKKQFLISVSSGIADPALSEPGSLVDSLAANGNGEAPFIFGQGDTDQRLSVSGFYGTFNTVRIFMLDNDPGKLFQTITLKSSTAATNSLSAGDYETTLGTFSPAGRAFTPYTTIGISAAHRVYFDLTFPAAPSGTRSLFFQSTTPGNDGGRIYEIQALIPPAGLVNFRSPVNLLAGKTASASSTLAGYGPADATVDGLAADNNTDAAFIFGDGDTDQRLSVSGFNDTFNTVRIFMIDNDPGRLFQAITLRSSTAPTNSLNPGAYETLLGTFSPAGRTYAEYAGRHRVYFDLTFPAAPAGTRSLFFQSTTAENRGGRIYEIHAFQQLQPAISIAPRGSNVLVTWSPSALETSTDLVLWSAVPGAISPLEVVPTELARFFRAVPDSQITSGGEPAVRLETGPARAEIIALGWDTEGSGRHRANLLRPQSAAGLRIRSGGQWRNGIDLPTQVDAISGNGKSYWLTVAPGAELNWRIESDGQGFTMHFSSRGPNTAQIEAVELAFPFSPGLTPVTALTENWTANWGPDDTFQLPAIVSAPDFGQMLLTGTSTAPGRTVVQKGRIQGNRAAKTVDLALELSPPQNGVSDTLHFAPHRLAVPVGLADTSLWPHARRGWFNAFQPSAYHQSTGHDLDRTPGILANNVISDRVINVMYRWSDAALLVPEAASGVSFTSQVRRTLDWLLENRVQPNGETIGYENRPMLDANAAPVISAWNYVEATGDTQWLAAKIAKLELMADFMANRDTDGDGLVELPNTGNYGEMTGYNSAWDTYNEGHKSGYINLLAYRAWRCLSDLERQLGRTQKQEHYRQLADRLKAVFKTTLYNPATGWLAWWKSADGQLHDYAWPSITSMAIVYGLVEPAEGRQMLDRLWKKVGDVGFNRFDLGLPCTLVPVRRGDYLGIPAFDPMGEDGTGLFQRYLNGGCVVSDTIEFLTASYIVGDNGRADQILRAMLKRQQSGRFQNGIGNGGEFMTWSGEPCGYEGLLTYSYSFLQAVLLREPSFRAQLYRPLLEAR